MPSSIFGQPPQGVAATLRNMMGGAAPDVFAERLMRTNPAFRQFVEGNRGKSLSQIASDYGLDYSAVRSQMGQ